MRSVVADDVLMQTTNPPGTPTRKMVVKTNLYETKTSQLRRGRRNIELEAPVASTSKAEVAAESDTDGDSSETDATLVGGQYWSTLSFLAI